MARTKDEMREYQRQRRARQKASGLQRVVDEMGRQLDEAAKAPPKLPKQGPQQSPPQDFGDAIKGLSQQQRDRILQKLAPPRTRSLST